MEIGTAGQVERSMQASLRSASCSMSCRNPAAATDGKCWQCSVNAQLLTQKTSFPTVKSPSLLSRLSVLVATYPELRSADAKRNAPASRDRRTVRRTDQLGRAAGAICSKQRYFRRCAKTLRRAPTSWLFAWKSICRFDQSSRAVGARASTTLPINRRLSRVTFAGFLACPTRFKLAQGRLPPVIHLLAPNQRAVQVTTDLRVWQARRLTQPFACAN